MKDNDVVRIIESFIDSDKERQFQVSQSNKHVILDYSELIRFDTCFGELISDEPERFFSLAELVVERIKERKVPVRVKNYHTIKSGELKVSDKRVEHLNKLWFIEGVVRIISEAKPLITSAEFECYSCGNTLKILQIATSIKQPTKCGCGAKGKFATKKVEKEDMMKLVLEEDIELLEGSEQPQRINILLRQGLTNKQIKKFATPGKKVIITGVLKDVPKITKSGKESTERDWLFTANYIQPLDDAELTIEISKSDEKQIKDLAKNPDVYNMLVRSIAPIVEGWEMEKLAVVLQQFGAVNKRSKHTGKIIQRGYFHIGFIGDPATAKTSISKGLREVSPKCRATSGKHASGAGLTWGANYDEFMKAWTIEAGSMVLANGGTMVVDEADKIDKDHLGKMNQGLEDGYFDASKMSIQATLRAETACLFIANPKHGRFDPHTSLFDQFDIDPTLVSRMSMMFVFRDTADSKKDENIAKRIFKSHAKTDKVLETEISPDIIKKYIMYARKNCKPKLNPSHEDYVADRYKDLRTKGNREGRVAITPRQLGDIIRIAESIAKVRLSKHVTKEDIDKAFELMLYSLKGFALDDEGNIDIDSIELGGKTYEARSKDVIFIDTFKELENSTGNKTFDYDIIVNALKDKGFKEADAEKWIAKASKEGQIFEPRNGKLGRLQ